MRYTKAEMLDYLKSNIQDINILPVKIIESDEYFNNKDAVVEEIISFAKGENLIVRSSSSGEDNIEFSNAGGYESVLDVVPDYKSIDEAIRKVYDSYCTETNQQILIQCMLSNIKKSGVIFTSDMDTMADYYIINYCIGNDTSAVTSGSGNNTKTFVKYKNKAVKAEDEDNDKLIDVCRKIESFLDNSALDIEFAVLYSGEVYILQVRPIARGYKNNIDYRIDLSEPLNRIYKKVEKLSVSHPFLLGESTCYGTMPDWNPAEILGIRPKKLSISLYKELITDSIWAHQRNNYGYRDLSKHPLMVSFCGIPYIDTRITFNSFVPEKLNYKIADKLVNYYLQKLKKFPKYHDKIEFEIVYSCCYLGIHDELKELLNNGFNEDEINRIEFALLDLTNNIISPSEGLYKKDILKVEQLKKAYENIVLSELSVVEKIYWLIEKCKEYGTLPFAGVARAAFIAVQILKSFVTKRIITEDEYDDFLCSIVTVNKKMQIDLNRMKAGKISKEYFLKIYGHIRPGTYDIETERYDEDFDKYFDCKFGIMATDSSSNGNEKDGYIFSETQMEEIQNQCDESGLLINAEDLITFIKESIEGREYLKFVFTQAVSEILLLVEKLGKRVGISRNDMAHLDVGLVKQLYSELYAGDVYTLFKTDIEKNKKQYDIAIRLKLPSIITSPEDVYQFELLDEEPNYITQKAITAQIAKDNLEDVEGKIVFIQSADPGYDFLFSKNIAGLVTQFGGANSHMAIRCAELGIPAIIGAGEKLYKMWSDAGVLIIDCLKRQVIVAKE